MSETDDDERVGYMEFTLPYRYDGAGELSYMVIDFNVTEWFREKFVEGYDEYPPSSEDACSSLAMHFEKNHGFYFNNGLVRDAMDDANDIHSASDLREAMDDGKLRFIY